jgi:hypothetical protein
MTPLMMYDMLRAQLKAGAILFKPSVSCKDDGNVYRILRLENGTHYFLYSCHPNLTNAFIDKCTEEGVAVILFDQWVEAEREAFLCGRRI